MGCSHGDRTRNDYDDEDEEDDGGGGGAALSGIARRNETERKHVALLQVFRIDSSDAVSPLGSRGGGGPPLAPLGLCVICSVSFLRRTRDPLAPERPGNGDATRAVPVSFSRVSRVRRT